ncbi:MAG TPA: GTP-binding protein [Bacteroidales bacterium]|nr:GTP-binding protein [Bacteroidales bacterium]
MIKKKVCMLGSFAVGKTSLVSRFVSSMFSDKYLTTIGVKIDQKNLTVEGTEVTLILWDIHGEDTFQRVPASYLKGSHGYFLVMDGTRAATFERLKELKSLADQTIAPGAPFLVLVNKCDLTDRWEFESVKGELEAAGWPYLLTSAKTGEGVEEAFNRLTSDMIL